MTKDQVWVLFDFFQTNEFQILITEAKTESIYLTLVHYYQIFTLVAVCPLMNIKQLSLFANEDNCLHVMHCLATLQINKVMIGLRNVWWMSHHNAIAELVYK